MTSIPMPGGPGATTPALTVVGDATLLTWQEPLAGGGARVLFSRRAAGAWGEPAEIAAASDILVNWADFPGVGAAPDGRLAAHWFRSGADDDSYDVALAHSLDGGRSWLPLGAPYLDGGRGEHGFVSWATEATGLRLFWLDGRDAGHGTGATQLRTAVVGAAGAEAESIVDARVCDCCSTAAVPTPAGALVVYRDREPDERRDISAARATGAPTGVPVATDGWIVAGCPVNGPRAASSGDRVAVAWFTGAGDRQRVLAAFSADGGASFGAPVTIAEPSGVARPVGRVDIVLEDGGEALVSWLSAEGADGVVRVRRVADDGRVGEPVAVGAIGTARTAGFPRIARTAEGLLVVQAAEGGLGGALLDPRTLPDAVAAPPAPAPSAPAPSAPAPSAPAVAVASATLPEFRGTDLQGRPLARADLAGRPVLLNFWATWCGPCRDELPLLARMAEAHPALAVVAVSLDGSGAGDSVRRTIERLSPGLRVLHPDAGLGASMGVAALPRTFLFAADGTLAWQSTGAVTEADLESALDRL